MPVASPSHWWSGRWRCPSLPAGTHGTAQLRAPAPTEPVPAAQLSAVAFRLREDEAVGGRFQVKVTNAGDRPVHVTAVGLESPVLAAEPATPRDTVLRPGGRGDLPVRHGPAVGEPAADATDVAAMPSPQQGGRERQVRLPLGTTKASRAVLARIHDESCTAQRIAAVVAATLVVGEPVAADVGLVLPASVVLERAGAVAEAPAVTATAVGGSALYGLAAPPGGPPGGPGPRRDTTRGAGARARQPVLGPRARRGEEAVRARGVAQPRRVGRAVDPRPDRTGRVGRVAGLPRAGLRAVLTCRAGGAPDRPLSPGRRAGPVAGRRARPG